MFRKLLSSINEMGNMEIQKLCEIENRRYTVNEISKLILQKICGAGDFIAMTRLSGRHEQVLNMLKKLKQIQTLE